MIVIYQKKMARAYIGSKIEDYLVWSYRVIEDNRDVSDYEGIIEWWIVPGTIE